MTAYSQIIRYIDTYLTANITLEDIAQAVGYSPHHIYKLFRVYSPYPVMKYIRRKKLYAALADMYTGRKLYVIALDYGFETPAGFYKAFKAVFGYAPSAYHQAIKKGEKTMIIEQIKDTTELDAVLAFWPVVYPHLPSDYEGPHADWLARWKSDPELFLYAKDNNHICGFVLGAGLPGQYITIHADGVAPEYKDKGVHEALFAEVERRAKQRGYYGLILGITEGAEEFYAKMGYVGRTLIQSEKYSIDELLAFNTQDQNYEVDLTRVHDGYINQLWLNVPLMDKALKKKYTEEIGDCWVQVIVNKVL